MNPWTSRPDDRDSAPHHQIIRAKPGKTTQGVVLSLDLIGAYTHYWKGRTTPCNPPACPACDAGHKPRWYGYLALWNPATAAVAILEITTAAVPAIETYLARHGSLRYAQIMATRANRKPNSRLIVSFQAAPYSGPHGPEPPDLPAHLSHMWEATSKPAPNRQPTEADPHAEAETLALARRAASNGHPSQPPLERPRPRY